MKKKITLFPARKVLTMNPEQPEATAVAVMDGRILGVGDLNELATAITSGAVGSYEVDTIFKDKILMPGIVEAHTHLVVPALEYDNHFVSQVPWPNPAGGFFPTYPTKAAVLERLKELDAQLPPGALLWGTHYDNNQAGGFLRREELDAISTTRPILVSNMVFHRFWVNTRLLEMTGVLQGAIPPGVEVDENGVPNGMLIEGKGFHVAARACPEIANFTIEKLRHIMPLFRSQGITTVTELVMGARPRLEQEIAMFKQLFDNESPGLRCISFPHMHRLAFLEGSREAAIQKLQHVMKDRSSTFHIGGAKLYHDGSIISHTSPLDWPGYWDGSPNREMQCTPEEIHYFIHELHKLGISTVTHTNTNMAVQSVLDAVEEAQCHCFRPDIRHRIEHCYTITAAQLRRAKTLGVAVQFFTPQIYYYGDSHLNILGPDRANHITPVGTAERLGVSWGIHSDPPGSPQLPWLAVWATVQRTTLQGRVLGQKQRVPVQAALRAITIEAAWQLHMEDKIGSIEFGKQADFCVLEADPLAMNPDDIKDMPVWGTVFEGVPCKGH